jgi:ribosome-associated toxin RatA of RatAB toxin-antitoxin module
VSSGSGLDKLDRRDAGPTDSRSGAEYSSLVTRHRGGLENRMDVHFTRTESAEASAGTLFDVVTDYSHYPRFNAAVLDVEVVHRDEEGAEFMAGQNTRIEKQVRAHDEYDRGPDLVVDRTYPTQSGARSTWTIRAVDETHSTLTVDAAQSVPWLEGVMMRPLLRRTFYGTNLTPFIREAERRTRAGSGVIA